MLALDPPREARAAVVMLSARATRRRPRRRPRRRRDRLRHQAVLLRRARRARARAPAHARASATRRRCRPPGSSSTCSAARSRATASSCASRRASSTCSPTSCATPTRRSRASRSSAPCGATTSTPARTSSRSTSATCGASSSCPAARRRSTRCARSATASRRGLSGDGAATARTLGPARASLVRSLRARLALAIAVILVAALGTSFVATYRGTGTQVQAQIDQDLRQDAERVRAADPASSRSRADSVTRAAQRYIDDQVTFTRHAAPVRRARRRRRLVSNQPELNPAQRRALDRDVAGPQRESPEARALRTAPLGFST